MTLKAHPEGNYQFLPGIAPYSGGVVASDGYEIVHATLHRPVPYRDGFETIAQHLESVGRPKAALCGIELRSPKPFTFAGFADFNGGYAKILEGWGLFVDGVNPVARTNVAPEYDPPGEPMLYGFSYTRPSVGVGATFVVAGAGELPEGILSAEAIVSLGDTSAIGLARKVDFVMDLMETRLRGLGRDWPDVTAVDIYTVHPYNHVIQKAILERIGRAATHGVRWFYTRPPIEQIEFEMDLRGVQTEVRLPGGSES